MFTILGDFIQDMEQCNRVRSSRDSDHNAITWGPEMILAVHTAYFFYQTIHFTVHHIPLPFHLVYLLGMSDQNRSVK
ncbi:hypothetical protein D3C81_1900230 [compost metagenome]